MKLESLDGDRVVMAVKDDVLKVRGADGRVERRSVSREEARGLSGRRWDRQTLEELDRAWTVAINAAESNPAQKRWVTDWTPKTGGGGISRMSVTVDGRDWRVLDSKLYDDRGSVTVSVKNLEFVRRQGRWFTTNSETWVHTQFGAMRVESKFTEIEDTDTWGDHAFELE